MVSEGVERTLSPDRKLHENHPKKDFIINFSFLPRHSVRGLGYRLSFVFHVLSQIAVEALKRMRETLQPALSFLLISSA